MSKKHMKIVSVSKIVAMLPYLRPMTNEEINQLEIETSWQEFLPKENCEDQFFEWMLEIDCAKIDREIDDHLCRQMELRYHGRVRRINQPSFLQPFFFDDDCWDMHSEDPDYDPRDEPMFDDRMYPDDDFYPWEDHQMLLSMEVCELSQCPEQELVRQIPLRGLPQQVRRALTREYCVI